MPLFMDRHNAPSASSEDMAQAHELDLEAQDRHGVRFLTYWFDQERNVAFCLVDAPDRQSVELVHQKAHGNIPTEIIEVEIDAVGKFLGRTEDPTPSSVSVDDLGHPEIDSAFRAIMFTDLQDSTAVSSFVGDVEAVELLEKHDEIIRGALLAHNGNEVKHTGDGFLTSFSSVPNCLNCAIAIQHAFKAFNKDEPVIPLHVRIGINAGLPVERHGDLFGVVVNMTARICAKAGPDEILVSGIIPALCAADAFYLEFEDAGPIPLKGIVDPIQLYKVAWNT